MFLLPLTFRPSDKRIRVTRYQGMDKVHVLASNEGDHIADAVRKQLFTCQIRSLKGPANEVGTGLRLAMSQQLACLNNAKKTLEPGRIDSTLHA